MSAEAHNLILQELYRSLDERLRPEEIALKVLLILDVSASERAILNKAAASAKKNSWFTMSEDFSRPVDMSRQLKVAQELFGRTYEFAPDDVELVENWIRQAEKTIGKEYAHNDFLSDRLSKADRTKAGIDMSRRQYNKRFRLAVRLERKARKLSREQFKRSLTLASKNRLAAKITWDDFTSNTNSACFIAYYVARCNLRSLFTNASQTPAYDEICEVLMQRCVRERDAANWWAVAHVLPTRAVIRQLDDEQKGVLLASYFNLLSEAASLLKELWNSSAFTADMVVQRGNDSTTWNVTAGAWNKLREGWFTLMYELGMVDAVAQMCPGKVMRLMAADVAAWHRMSGGGIQPDTLVWQDLPHPWEVLSGDAYCSKDLVDQVCAKHQIDPVKSGWSAPKPPGTVVPFTPTPELVHGVVVESPLLAAVFRKIGVFSGKATKGTVPFSTVLEIRNRHRNQQQEKRAQQEQAKREN